MKNARILGSLDDTVTHLEAILDGNAGSDHIGAIHGEDGGSKYTGIAPSSKGFSPGVSVIDGVPNRRLQDDPSEERPVPKARAIWRRPSSVPQHMSLRSDLTDGASAWVTNHSYDDQKHIIQDSDDNDNKDSRSKHQQPQQQ